MPEDPTSGQAGQLPTYNAYSADGDVTAPLVYANYGVPEDYEQLAKMGISVKGKIVITRYGHSWRGIKPKLAYEHGAVGCLIYSDPRDDGYFEGDVFPEGAVPPRAGRAARQRDGDGEIPGRSGNARLGRDAGVEAARAQGRDEPAEDSGAPDFVRRRRAAAEGARRPDGADRLARRAADHLPGRPGTGERAPGGEVGLEGRARLRRHREDPRQHAAGSVDRARQPLRRLGERRVRSDQRPVGAARGGARVRRAAQAGMEAEADDHLLRVGRRGAGAARLDRMGRSAPRRAAAARRRLHQLGRQRQGLPERRRQPLARALRQPGREGDHRSRDGPVGLGEAAAARPGAREDAGGEGRDDGRRRPPHRRARLGVGLLAVPRSRRRARRCRSATAARAAAACTTRSTTTSTGTRTSPTRRSSTAARSRRPTAR